MINRNRRCSFLILMLFALLQLSFGCGAGGGSGSQTKNNGSTDNETLQNENLFSRLYRISKSNGDSDKPILSFDSTGRAYILYKDNTSGKEGIYFTSLSGSGNSVSFSVPEIIHSSPSAQYDNQRIDIDSNGLIFAAYTGPYQYIPEDKNHTFLAYSGSQTSIFSQPLLISNFGNSAGSHSLTITPNNHIYIAWDEGGEVDEEVRHIFYSSAPTIQPGAISKPENISGTSGDSEGPLLGFDGSFQVYAVWREKDTSTGNRSIYFKHNISKSPPAPINISAGNTPADHPVISCPGSHNIVITWEEGLSPYREIYYAVTQDGGKGFTDPANLSVTPYGDSYDPGIACGISGDIYVVWTDTESGNREIYFRASHNSGNSFMDMRNISRASGDSASPSIAANSYGDIIVAWTDTNPGKQDIFTAGSQDRGISFSKPLNLSGSAGSSTSPVAGWNGLDGFIVAWVDDTWDNNKEIILRTGGWVSSRMISTPKIISPKDSSNTLNNPSFYWTSVDGATTYHLQVADHADFSSLVVDTDLSTNSVKSRLTQGVYYARVKARDSSAQWTSYSEPVRVFVGYPPQDIDGDGYSDIIIGAPGVDNATGTAYIYYGGESGSTQNPVTLSGEKTGDQFGSSVTIAGDVNGDGLDDILIGAPEADAGIYSNNGKVYLYTGRESGGPVLCKTLTGNGTNEWMGDAVSGAGDVNRDGFADFLVGAPGANGGGARRGSAHLFLGRNDICNSASSSLSPDVTFDGPSELSLLGSSIISAGDVNNDGYNDFMIGSAGDMSSRGVVFLYLGWKDPAGMQVITFSGGNAGDSFGQRVAPAGDINIDGYDDILISAPGAENGIGPGETYIFYGGPFMDTAPDLIITGENQYDRFGNNVAGIGDVNSDGYVDILINAHLWDIPMSYKYDAGRTYLFSGASLSQKGKTELIASEGDVIWEGTEKGSYLGYWISGTGDFNGDGIVDFAISAPGASVGGNHNGSVYLIYGKETILPDTSYDLILNGDNQYGQFGSTLDKQRVINH